MRLLVRFLAAICLLVGSSLDARQTWAQEPVRPSWVSLPDALEQAGRTDQLVLVYVRAPWCGPCRRMERDVFPQLQLLLKQLALAELDFDDHHSRVRLGKQGRSPFDWARHFGIDATPGFVLLTPEGIPVARSTGFLGTHAFGLLLAYATTGAYRHASFEDYVRQTWPDKQAPASPH